MVTQKQKLALTHEKSQNKIKTKTQINFKEINLRDTFH